MDPLYQRLQQLIAAWRTKDIGAVLSFLHEDVVWHYAAGAAAPVRGRAMAAKLLGRFTEDMHGIEWRIFAHAESGDRLFVEGVDEYTTADGKRIAAPYAGVLEFKDGLILGWRDYVDIGVIAQQKAGEPITPHVKALLSRATV
jgi:limonene-1,2-epoxide hydrolase